MHSTFSQASACWRISLPRAPGPMMPRRIRWFAPRALLGANVPARPVATRPMKLRRDCMGIGLLGRKPIIYGRDAGAEASGETGSRAHQAEHAGGRGRVRRWGGTGSVPVVMLDLALEPLLLRSVRVLAVDFEQVLLGMDILRQFAIVIEPSGSVVLYEPEQYCAGLNRLQGQTEDRPRPTLKRDAIMLNLLQSNCSTRSQLCATNGVRRD